MDATNFRGDIPLAIATAAHAGTSFTPDRRGEQEDDGYASTLAQDWTELSKLATTDAKRETLAEMFNTYRAGYRMRTIAALTARGRCLSSMITGPSRFPTARNATRNATADKRLSEAIDYRAQALLRIRKSLTPELQPIMAGASDAVSRLDAEIAKLEERQADMKAANAAIRKAAKGGPDAQVAALLAIFPNTKESTARELITPDFCGRIGFADYQIKNNGANLRRLKARRAAIATAKATEDTVEQCSRARLEDSPADNRVRLFFDGKPEADVRDRLKRHGFRWTPSLGCWQAYRNHTSISIARTEAGLPVDEAAS